MKMRHPVTYQRELIAKLRWCQPELIEPHEYENIADALEDALACIVKLESQAAENSWRIENMRQAADENSSERYA